MRRTSNLTSLSASVFLGLVLLLLSYSPSFVSGVEYDENPLLQYVESSDDHFSYQVRRASRTANVSVYDVHMTSQKWLDASRVDRPVWTHWLKIILPQQVRTSTSFIWVTGGSNDQHTPQHDPDGSLVEMAISSGAIVAELRQIPNQPLEFEDKSGALKEDAMIAYAWNKYLETSNPEWLPRLPMTKAVVRAMDTVTEISESLAGDSSDLTSKNFVIGGASKRGWTTWTTGIADKRVIGIAPVVIDMLNLVPSFQHHWESYGFYAPAVGDYERGHIMKWRESAQFKSLMEIVEPYEYRHSDRLNLSKFILNATGDQYFLPDSWRFYWHDLPGTKYLRYVPNADHSLKGSDGFESLKTFFHCLAHGIDLPEIEWRTVEGGQIEVSSSTSTHPSEVSLWSAFNPDARDFRVESLGKVWKKSSIDVAEDGKYVTRVAIPDSGYTAFLLEFTFKPAGSQHPFKLTTGTHILPDVLPFDFDTGKPRESTNSR